MTNNSGRIERYYDTHEVPGGEGLNQTFAHFYTIRYLIDYVNKLFCGKRVGVLSRVNIKLNRQFKEGPDIAVIDGLDLKDLWGKGVEEFQIGKHGSAPRVIFEITSALTWRQDLEVKPARYCKMGVTEYFVYGPEGEPTWNENWNKHNRLVGWRRNNRLEQYELLEKDKFGRLWSDELASWLVVEPAGLRLYDVDGELRLTEAEALQQRLEAETRRANAVNLEKQKLVEKLRKLGINPEELL